MLCALWALAPLGDTAPALPHTRPWFWRNERSIWECGTGQLAEDAHVHINETASRFDRSVWPLSDQRPHLPDPVEEFRRGCLDSRRRDIAPDTLARPMLLL